MQFVHIIHAVQIASDERLDQFFSIQIIFCGEHLDQIQRDLDILSIRMAAHIAAETKDLDVDFHRFHVLWPKSCSHPAGTDLIQLVVQPAQQQSDACGEQENKIETGIGAYTVI